MSDPNIPPPGGAPPPSQPPPGGGGFNPPPGQPPQPYQPGGGGAPQLDVGASLSYAWDKFSSNWSQYVLLMLGVWAAGIIAALLAFLVLLPAIGTDGNTVLGIIGGALAFTIVFVVVFAVQAGVYRAGLGATQGITPSFSMFTDGTNFGAYILTVLLVGIGAFIGIILCIIPGLIWMFFTAYAPLRALDKGEGAVDAIKGSIDMVRDNIGQVLLILIVAYAIYYLGSLCAIGLLVSIPVALIMICWSYRVILQEPVAP
jgi:uncharacterized membrane protein